MERRFDLPADLAIKALEGERREIIRGVEGDRLPPGDPCKGKLTACNIRIGRIIMLAQVFKGRDVQTITRDVVVAFAQNYQPRKRGRYPPGQHAHEDRAPKLQTILGINNALQCVWDEAVGLGWMADDERPVIRASDLVAGAPGEPKRARARRARRLRRQQREQRPELTVAQMRHVLERMTDAWVEGPRLRKSVENRLLLRVWFAILAATGARPGTELSLLRWYQVLQPGGQLLLKIVNGKTGDRDAPVDETVWRVTELLSNLCRRQGNPPDDRFIFARSDGRMPIFGDLVPRFHESTPITLP